jgi:uncharacterized protein (UPF0335 family)
VIKHLKELIERLETIKNEVKDIQKELTELQLDFANMTPLDEEIKSLKKFLTSASKQLAYFVWHIDSSEHKDDEE